MLPVSASINLICTVIMAAAVKLPMFHAKRRSHIINPDRFEDEHIVILHMKETKQEIVSNLKTKKYCPMKQVPHSIARVVNLATDDQGLSSPLRTKSHETLPVCRRSILYAEGPAASAMMPRWRWQQQAYLYPSSPILSCRDSRY